MKCDNCGYPNPNGYVGACKSCRQPLVAKQETIQLAESVRKKVKKASSKKIIVEPINGENN